MSDAEGVLVKRFDVKMFLLPLARRVTFAVGAGGQVLSVQEGSDALDPTGAVSACSLAPPQALRILTGVDGGAAK